MSPAGGGRGWNSRILFKIFCPEGIPLEKTNVPWLFGNSSPAIRYSFCEEQKAIAPVGVRKRGIVVLGLEAMSAVINYKRSQADACARVTSNNFAPNGAVIGGSNLFVLTLAERVRDSFLFMNP